MPGPAGVAVRARLRLSAADVAVLCEVGAFLGGLAAGDLAVRSRQGLGHDAGSWAVRKRELTGLSSARWAGSITKATHDQWALARRGQARELAWLRGEIASIEARLGRPLGARADKRARLPRGYGSRVEWHAKSRRLHTLQDRLARLEEDWSAGRVHVLRGGKRLARLRHHLDEAGLDAQGWRERWQAARMFLTADGESGKRFGNETIRVTDAGRVSVRLPAALAHLANAPHDRYVLDAAVRFQHRSAEWADRITANRAVAYRIHHDPVRGRWYVTASWQHTPAPVLPLEAALARGVVAVDMNDDHLAAWQLDVHGNPVGEPRRFFYDLTGSTQHRDAQIRHALTRLLHHTRRCGAAAIAIENLDFTDGTSREKHGRNKRFRRLISRFPTARLKARLASMAAEQGIALVAVDPAYTSRWGAQHWQQPLTTSTRKTTRHDAAAVAIGRRALGHPIRRRTAPPRTHQSDGYGHRTAQAGPNAPGREGPRPRIPGPRTRCVPPGRGANAGDQRAQHRSGHAAEPGFWQQDSLPLSP
ncbi:IS200/IS605 family accessory protein TnpB-related protein [Streptomyces sp. NBC_00841]|uniref:IS200/IS605 family accessory protein TnpB-related protein n=1 Tax=unclassified Streptomyces TaxID=2593676 RepID=UPI00225BBD49|nr:MULTISPECIES: IS200/IS605 family accessory protein TnpB-related protein [unclassified Streptomyces]MCX4530754.1 IS200/IS605 family accessory protein TnpB-related protein [Streptomyces sp. NBC_01669]WSA03501.1 IS200/IS605 family accessory protein TnpB-related protein [Streptomyces sp. NBC_00841]